MTGASSIPSRTSTRRRPLLPRRAHRDLPGPRAGARSTGSAGPTRHVRSWCGDPAGAGVAGRGVQYLPVHPCGLPARHHDLVIGRGDFDPVSVFTVQRWQWPLDLSFPQERTIGFGNGHHPAPGRAAGVDSRVQALAAPRECHRVLVAGDCQAPCLRPIRVKATEQDLSAVRPGAGLQLSAVGHAKRYARVWAWILPDLRVISKVHTTSRRQVIFVHHGGQRDTNAFPGVPPGAEVARSCSGAADFAISTEEQTMIDAVRSEFVVCETSATKPK